LKKHKEGWATSEKIRRDAWMQEKTKEIKEMTVKGLEPEIHKLLAVPHFIFSHGLLVKLTIIVNRNTNKTLN
jgi:hypothetical protein